MQRFLASLLTTCVALLLVPWLWARPKTRPGLAARLGRPALPAPPAHAVTRVWAHAASAGDIKNLWPVVRLLLGQRADIHLTLTTVTNSGADMAQAMAPAPHAFTYLPLDAPFAVRRAVAAMAPQLVLLECTELWPMLLATLHAHSVPVVLCNGRLSQRSLTRYRWLFRVLPNPVPHLALLLCQTRADADRYVALGADPARVHVVGNSKFDASAATPPAQKVALLADVLGAGPWLAAGSTHAGEEDVVLDALTAARKVDPATRLLWAPRYAEHVEGLLEAARQRGFSSARRSAGPPDSQRADVVLLDSMGELAAAYAGARVALVGGSWVERGGQNILEPAAVGVPVVHGPHMFNLRDLADALDGVGALNVPRAEAAETVASLMRDPARAAALGAAGRERVQALSGAAARHMEHLAAVVPPPRRA